MTAIYSESLSCLLTFAGMLYLERYKKKRYFSWDLFLSAAFFGLGSLNRSNANLLSLFIAYERLKDSPSIKKVKEFTLHWIMTLIFGIVAIGPQMIYFFSIILTYCPSWKAPQSERNNDLIDRPWCAASFPMVFRVYLFIQREYWDVGAFRYYQLKQLPNFLLASPIILLSFYGIGKVISCRWLRRPRKDNQVWYSCSSIDSYTAHWAFLTLNGIVVVHIQVLTRLLSSCPILYWFYSSLINSSTIPYSKLSWKAQTLLFYFALYNLLGAAMFCNFYPWT